jgi:hypothetical protein
MRAHASISRIPLALVLLVFAIVTLAGCQSPGGQSQLTEQLAIQYATLKITEGKPDRAARIHAIASDAKTFLSGEAVTLSALNAAVRDKIDFSKLDAADTLLVNALLGEVQRQLAAKLGEGLLNPDALVHVNRVLDWIIAVTEVE